MVGPANGSITTWLSGEGTSPTAAPEPGTTVFSANALLLRIGTSAGRSDALGIAWLPDVCWVEAGNDGSPTIAVLESAYGCTVETALKSVLTTAASSGSNMGDEFIRE